RRWRVAFGRRAWRAFVGAKHVPGIVLEARQLDRATKGAALVHAAVVVRSGAGLLVTNDAGGRGRRRRRVVACAETRQSESKQDNATCHDILPREHRRGVAALMSKGRAAQRDPCKLLAWSPGRPSQVTALLLMQRASGTESQELVSILTRGS